MKEKFFFFLKNVSGPSNAPDEVAQNVSKKTLSDELFLHFSSKVQNLTVFSIIYMIRIRFFGPGELFQNGLGSVFRLRKKRKHRKNMEKQRETEKRKREENN